MSILYGANRFANLDADYVAEKYSYINDDVKSYSRFLQEENNTLDNDYFLETASISEDYNYMMEIPLSISNIDYSMLESYIESAFIIEMDDKMQAIKESKEVAQLKRDLTTNSSVLIDSTTATIISGGKYLLIKLKELFASDKKVYDKYIVALSKKNILKDFEGIKSIDFPKKSIGDFLDSLVDTNDIIAVYDKFIDDLRTAKDDDRITEVVENLTDDIDSLLIKHTKAKAAMETKTNWVPNAKEIDIMCEFIKGDSINKNISKNTKSLTDTLNKLKKKAKKDYDDITISSNDHISIRKSREIYHAISGISKLAIKMYNNYKDLTVRQLASMRKAFIICGKYANTVYNNKVVTKEEFDLFEDMTSSASDIYVFEMFSDN